MLHPDAPAVQIDAEIDAPPQLAPLIGTWNLAPEANQDIGLKQVVFHANGTTTVNNNGQSQAGTFSVPSPGRIILGDASGNIESSFLIGDGHLLLTAYLPQGTVTDFVGTWAVVTVQNSQMVTTSLEVRADHTATLTFTSTTTGSLSGTWATEQNGFAFTNTAGGTSHYRPIGTQAIGELYFVRAP